MNTALSLSKYGDNGFTFEQILNDSGVYFINVKNCIIDNDQITSTTFIFKSYEDLKFAFQKQVDKIRENTPFRDFSKIEKCFECNAKQNLRRQGDGLVIIRTSNLTEEELEDMDSYYSYATHW